VRAIARRREESAAGCADDRQRGEQWGLPCSSEAESSGKCWAFPARRDFRNTPYGPSRENGRRLARGELYALYVAPELIGTGAGRALMTEALARATAEGFPDLALWVLKGNAPARRFYERAGFRPDGAEETFEADGVLVPEVRYVRALGGPVTP
jgi:GNAT superfamily N-acetyltransferase